MGAGSADPPHPPAILGHGREKYKYGKGAGAATIFFVCAPMHTHTHATHTHCAHCCPEPEATWPSLKEPAGTEKAGFFFCVGRGLGPKLCVLRMLLAMPEAGLESFVHK